MESNVAATPKFEMLPEWYGQRATAFGLGSAALASALAVALVLPLLASPELPRVSLARAILIVPVALKPRPRAIPLPPPMVERRRANKMAGSATPALANRVGKTVEARALTRNTRLYRSLGALHAGQMQLDVRVDMAHMALLEQRGVPIALSSIPPSGGETLPLYWPGSGQVRQGVVAAGIVARRIEDPGAFPELRKELERRQKVDPQAGAYILYPGELEEVFVGCAVFALLEKKIDPEKVLRAELRFHSRGADYDVTLETINSVPVEKR